jgi:hypothetical protein
LNMAHLLLALVLSEIYFTLPYLDRTGKHDFVLLVFF